MTTQLPSQAERLEVRASKAMNRFWLGLYLVFLIGMPWMGWTAFGPGAAGDTAVNGNSIWAFWFMRVCVFAMWVTAFFGIKRSLHLLKELPILFALDKIGITNRAGITTPWRDFERAFYNRHSHSLHLNVRPKTQFENIVIKSEEIGFAAMDKIEAFMLKHAPSHLTNDF